MEPPSQSTASRSSAIWAWAVGLALAATVLVVYSQTWGKEFDFVNLDDEDYVVANSRVKAGLTPDGLLWALTTFHVHNWHPLTWLSLQLDSQLFGTSAQGYHRTNVLLHAANAVLLFLLLQRLTGALWRSAAVAAFFAVHPTHVESVAWVAERKDVLSTLFWLLTIAAYAWYAERPGAGRYLLVGLTFVLGLTAKPMLVTLPAVLLLLDYWPLRRWPVEEQGATRYAPASLGRIVAEKVPLLGLAGLSILLTLQAQTKLVEPLEQFPLSVRVANALVSYVKYLGMTLWPTNLAFFYPHPREFLPRWQPLSAAVLLAGLTIGLLWLGRKRRYLAVGWLWYLGTLVPVIGLVQVATQALADRYTYVPSIGLFILLAWGAADFCSRGSGRVVPAAVLTGAALAVLSVMTWLQIQYWRDSETLWRHTLAVTESNAFAHEGLGLTLARKGELAEAVKHLEASLRLAPSMVRIRFNIAMALEGLGVLDEAGTQQERALLLEPGLVMTRLHLGWARQRQGRHADAARLFADALQIDPELKEARIGLARALADKGEFVQAREQYDILLRAEPDLAPLHYELGCMLKRQGRLTEAVACYDRALELQPEFHEAWNSKGEALQGRGLFDKAIPCYRRAVELAPDQQAYRVNFAYALRALRKNP